MQLIKNGRIYLRIDYKKRNAAKQIPGSQWHPGARQWSVPAKHSFIVGEMFPEFRDQINHEIHTAGGRVTAPKALPRKKRNLDWNLDYNFKRPPFEHQLRMIKVGLIEKQFAFFCEMGTGKTKVIIDIYSILRQYSRISGPCLIVSPLTVCSVWEGEISKDSSLSVNVIHGGSKRKRIQQLLDGPDFHIMNYDGILSIGECSEIWDRFDMVVLDESTAIKNHKAKRTKLIIKAFHNTPYKYILSGTPVTQGAVDLYTQLSFLNPTFTPFKSFYSYRNYFCVMGGFQNYQIIAEKNQAELKKMVGDHSIQLKKEDCCLDLPEKTYSRRELDMSKEMKQQYKDMKSKLIIWISETEKVTASNILTKLQRLQQILTGCYLQSQKDNNKLQEIIEVVQNNIKDQQIIIWCRFRKSIEILRETFKDIPYSVLYGDIQDRAEQIDKFQSGEHRLFITQTQTGGVGIPLTKGSLVLIYENMFSLMFRKQLEDRVHRPGQNKKCTYIDFVYKGTIDEKVLTALRHKQDVSNYLVNSFMKGEY